MTTSLNSAMRVQANVSARGQVVEPKDADLYRENEDSAVPRLSDEFEKTISDIAMGDEPSTVTHVLLLERNRGLSKAAIAQRLGKTSFQIEGTLALLEEQGWVVRFTENAREKYIIRGAIR